MTNLPKPAQYLLRIDDLCPTVNARLWDRLRLLIHEFSIRPILAVIPSNEDRHLAASPPDAGFWEQMRAMEEGGATIALHGLNHVCNTEGRSLIHLHRDGEFSGRSIEEQRSRIARGLDILRDHRLDPRLFVAPRHNFDRNTLRALKLEKILYLSDGFARLPFQRGGVTWIPMQLWAPAVRSRGLWTICVHPNSTDGDRLRVLRAFLRRFAPQFSCFDRIQEEFPASQLSAGERLYEMAAAARLRLRHLRSSPRNHP